MGSRVEYRMNRKLVDGLDEKLFMDGSFAGPLGVTLGKKGK